MSDALDFYRAKEDPRGGAPDLVQPIVAAECKAAFYSQLTNETLSQMTELTLLHRVWDYASNFLPLDDLQQLRHEVSLLRNALPSDNRLDEVRVELQNVMDLCEQAQKGKARDTGCRRIALDSLA